MSKTEVKEVKAWKDMTFLEKAISFIKGGDEANVKNILKVAKKRWAKQIALKKRSIKDLKEKLVETLEDQQEYRADELAMYKESFLNIDAEIKGRDNVVYYVENSYEYQISNAKAKLDKRDVTIADLSSATAKAIEKLEAEIETYEDFIAEIK